LLHNLLMLVMGIGVFAGLRLYLTFLGNIWWCPERPDTRETGKHDDMDIFGIGRHFTVRLSFRHADKGGEIL